MDELVPAMLHGQSVYINIYIYIHLHICVMYIYIYYPYCKKYIYTHIIYIIYYHMSWKLISFDQV